MLTAEQRDVCNNLAESAAKGMRSKRMLRILSALHAKELIEYDPFSGTAKLTVFGLAELAQGKD